MSRRRIHNFTFYALPNADGFSLGNIPGIAMYPDRSVLLPGVCYLDGTLRPEVAEEHRARYLNPLGIGAREIRFVHGGESLYEGILADEHLRRQLVDELGTDRTASLEAFSACPEWDRFVGSLNLDVSRLRTPSLSVMQLLDDKEAFRRLAHTLGLTSVFPEHVFVHEKAELLRLIPQWRRRYPNLVVLKRPDLESGVGQLLVTPAVTDEQIGQYVQTYCTGRRPVIIEQGIIGVEGSLQWYVGEDGPEPRCFSRQYTQNGYHEGNVVSHDATELMPADWSNTIKLHLMKDLWSKSRVFVEWMANHGHVGPLGFDFIMCPDGTWYFLECNARTTASTYLESVRFQIESQGWHHLCAAMKNAYPKQARDWHQAVGRLREQGLSFNPETGKGTIIANPRLMYLEYPKCLAIAIGDSVEEAEANLEQSLLTLS